MKRVVILSLASALLSLSAAAQPSIALTGGKIFTNDPAKPFAQAIAIKGPEILAVGTDAEINALVTGSTRRVKLNGAVVVPGINDAHMHPACAPAGFGLVVGIDAPFSLVSAALASAVDETPADLLIFAEVGAPVINDPAVTAQALDGVAPGRKVVLFAFTGHGLIMSSAAMAFFGINPTDADPPGGRYGRDATGKINGRAFEYAQYPVMRKLAELPSDEELNDAFRALTEEAIGFGITSIQAMPCVSENRFAGILASVRPHLRVRSIRFPVAAPALGSLLQKPTHLDTNGLKWILDGTPIEKGAALRVPYAGGGTGIENFTNVKLLIQEGLHLNQQLLFHGAGDKTIQTLLNALKANTSVDWPSKRVRIEHGDGLQSDLFPLAKELGVTVVQNPTHFPFRGTYPAGQYMLMKTLLGNQIPLAIGSDGPLNPWLGIMLAVTRGDHEALRREEAIAAYTKGSAFAEQAENQKGTLKAGFLADLAVLSQDVFTVPVAALPDTRATMTIIGGKIVHSEE